METAAAIRGRGWFDDLAIVTAAGIARSPRFWFWFAALVIVVVGPAGLPGGVAIQVGCGAIVGVLGARLLGRDPFGTVSLYLLPAVAIAVHVLVWEDDPHADYATGVPMAILAGVLLAAVTAVRGTSPHLVVSVPIVIAGIVAKLMEGHDGALQQDAILISPWIALWALAVAACIAHASADVPSPARNEENPGREATPASFLWWGLLPAIGACAPVPPFWYPSFQDGALLVVAVFLGRVATHARLGVATSDAAHVADRLAHASRTHPWVGAAIISFASLVLGWVPWAVFASAGRWVTVDFTLTVLGSPYHYESLAMAAVIAVGAHGPMRCDRRRHRLSAWIMPMAVPLAVHSFLIIPPIAIELGASGPAAMASRYVEMSVRWAEYLWREPLLPVGLALLVPWRRRALGFVDATLLAILCALFLAVANTYTDGWDAERDEVALRVLAQSVGVTAIALLLFHRLATTRVATERLVRRGLVVGGVLASLTVAAFLHGSVIVRPEESLGYGSFGSRLNAVPDILRRQIDSTEFRFAAVVQFFSSWGLVVAALAAARVLALGGRSNAPASVVREGRECETTES